MIFKLLHYKYKILKVIKKNKKIKLLFFKMASILRIIFITFLFTEALTWTIDLPEIRKDLFEKNERIKANVKKYRVEDFSRNDVYYYDNKDGNSLHHAESEKDTPQYAGEYGYQPYMEKKVSDFTFTLDE